MSVPSWRTQIDEAMLYLRNVLQNNVEGLLEENAKLKRENDSLMKEKAKWSQKCLDLEDTNKRLDLKTEELKSILEHKREKLERQSNEVKEKEKMWNEHFENLRERIHLLKQEISELKQENLKPKTLRTQTFLSRRKNNIKYREVQSPVSRSTCLEDVTNVKAKLNENHSLSGPFKRPIGNTVTDESVLYRPVKQPRLLSPVRTRFKSEDTTETLSGGDNENISLKDSEHSTSRAENSHQTQPHPPPATMANKPDHSEKMRDVFVPMTVEPLTEDMDETNWNPDANVGLPSLASTPVIVGETEQLFGCSPVKFSEHFEDNEMSVPDSPAVVSSDNVHVAIQNTPERKPVDIEESDQQKMSNFVFKSPQLTPRRMSRLSLPNLIDSKELKSKTEENEKTGIDPSDDLFGDETSDDRTSDDNCDMKINILGSDHEMKSREQDEQKIQQRMEHGDESEDSFLRSFRERKQRQENYKYNEVVRKRDERDKLSGYECPECKKWFSDEKEDGKKEHLRHVCRHKARHPPPPDTPEDFWSIGFPNTEEYIDKGYMLDEEDSLPSYAQPKWKRKRNLKKKI